MAHKVVRHSQCDRDIADSTNAIPDLVKAFRIYFFIPLKVMLTPIDTNDCNPLVNKFEKVRAS